MTWVSLPFLIATIFCLFRRSNRIRYPVRRHPKEGKTDEEKTKADREKMCSSDDNKPRWSEMGVFPPTSLIRDTQMIMKYSE